MTDSNSPDQDPKPFKPDTSKGPFGWYKPPTEPPRKLNLGDDQPDQDQAPTTDQELFQHIGVELAKTATELEFLLKKFPVGMYRLKDETYVNHDEELIMMSTHKGLGGGSFYDARIAFLSYSEEQDVQGIKTKNVLNIDPALDQEDISEEENIFMYKYFISPDGKCVKQERFFPGKKLIDSPKNGRNTKMTLDDYEVIKHGLTTLLDILKPQQEKPAE